ncbi:hypothetical protein L6452_35717 [Arctium lappa]|uniref:Uncharacterized protein n=1 Tax=Arctium lappa TaxID=4217 RepID=A0ACB8Y8D5_ARCLA|nr:hypothetical protein L6452_35717 [Arctium lappa]
MADQNAIAPPKPRVRGYITQYADMIGINEDMSDKGRPYKREKVNTEADKEKGPAKEYCMKDITKEHDAGKKRSSKHGYRSKGDVDSDSDFEMGCYDIEGSPAMCSSMIVPDKKPPLCAWTYNLMKLWESHDLANGGFGRQPLKIPAHSTKEIDEFVQQVDESNGCRSKSRETTMEEYIKRFEDKLSIFYAMKEELDADVATASSQFPCEDAFVCLKDNLDRFLRRGRWEDHGNSGTKKAKGSEDTSSRSKEIVLSHLQQRNDSNGIPPPCTNKGTSPRADRTINAEDEINLSKSRGKKKFGDISPPTFDLGLSPTQKSNEMDIQLKTPTATNLLFGSSSSGFGTVRSYKSMKNITHGDDLCKGVYGGITRAARRAVKLGDHLRSPFVNRVVEISVTLEDKRFKEWALAGHATAQDFEQDGPERLVMD